jgi:hypothetical protein
MDDTQKLLLLHKIETIERELQSLKELLGVDASEKIFVEKKIEAVREYLPEEIVAALFTLAQHQYGDEEIPKALATILHSSIRDHNIALDNFIRYSFKTFQGRWTDYLTTPTDPSSFTISRKQENNRGELSELRLYLHVDHRSDTPITLKQDPLQSMGWKIFALSL